MNYTDQLIELRACSDAVTWLRERNFATLQEAWDACERSDWMWWLIRNAWRMDPPCEECRKRVVLMACDTAESVKHLWTDATRDVNERAIETARRWTRGEATAEECRAASAAARAAFWADAAWDAARDTASVATARKKAAAHQLRHHPPILLIGPGGDAMKRVEWWVTKVWRGNIDLVKLTYEMEKVL